VSARTVHLGDLPSWFAAVGTAGAFGVSLWLLRQQIQDRRAQSADHRAAQARLVAGWAEDFDFEAKPFPEVVLMVRNGSDLPVYEVSIRAGYGVVGTFVRNIGSMGPDETRELRIQLPASPRADPSTPEMQFTDAGQRRWLRDATGGLRELGKREVVLFTEDAGAYDTPSEHPTLSLVLSPEQRRATRSSEGCYRRTRLRPDRYSIWP
jgi:hypothetical protein